MECCFTEEGHLPTALIFLVLSSLAPLFQLEHLVAFKCQQLSPDSVTWPGDVSKQLIRLCFKHSYIPAGAQKDASTVLPTSNQREEPITPIKTGLSVFLSEFTVYFLPA